MGNTFASGSGRFFEAAGGGSGVGGGARAGGCAGCASGDDGGEDVSDAKTC